MVRFALRNESLRAFATALMTSAVFLCASAGPGLAQEGRAKGAAPPDFSGFWGHSRFNMEPPYMTRDGQVIGGFNSPTLQPWATDKVMRDFNTRRAGGVVPNANVTCWPDGLVNALGLTEMQVLQTPTHLIFLYTDNHQVRYVYLNQPHQPGPTQQWYGDSVGHFEGGTLVVDTIGFGAKPQASVDKFGVPVSEKLHVTERYRFVDSATQLPPDRPANAGADAGRPSRDEGRANNLIAEGRTVELVYTVEDPATFRQPWTKTVLYKPFKGPLREYVCAENNRDWAHLMPVASPPDF